MTNFQYPIGTYVDSAIRKMTTAECLDLMEALPERLIQLLVNADDKKLQTPVRPEAWSPAQLCYHLYDSHLNGYVRHMLTLTEDHPTIKPYDQDAWIKYMPDNHDMNDSALALQLLHKRWCAILRTLTPEQLQRTYFHPEDNRINKLEQSIRIYAWHGEHHVKQIELGLK